MPVPDRTFFYFTTTGGEQESVSFTCLVPCEIAVRAVPDIVRAVPMTLDQLGDETRQLPPDVRAEPVERILLSAHGGLAPHIDGAWKQETRRRVADI